MKTIGQTQASKTTITATQKPMGDNMAQAAKDQERIRILGIQAALAGDDLKAVCDKACAEGWDLARAKAAGFDVIQAKRAEERIEHAAKLAVAQTRLDAIANSGHADELLGQADTSTESQLDKACDRTAAQAFQKGIDDLMAAGVTKAVAISKMVGRDKAGHAAWVASRQKNK